VEHLGLVRLVTSGLIHLHLWDIAYRNVGTLDVLFLVQTVLCILVALALLITRQLLVVRGRGDAAADRRPPLAAAVAPRRTGCPLEDNPSRGRGTA
jgi:uncharacterized membrane protein